MKQLNLFPETEQPIQPAEATNNSQRQRIEKKFSPIIREELRLGKLVAYGGNKAIPLLRLYRYKEAFAFGFVKEFIQRFKLGEDDYLFDPFCGMGTSLFTAMQHNIPGIGIDRLPIATFLAQTLSLLHTVEVETIRDTFKAIKTQVIQAELAKIASDVAIMKVAFPEETLGRLQAWKTTINQLSSPMRDVFMLLFLSILEPCSYTAKDGQFLRLKQDKILAYPDEILEYKTYELEKDILSLRYMWGRKKPIHLPIVQLGDARNISNINFQKQPTAIITSPPYANRYDYTRTYSLELCFNFVNNFEELKALRFGILRSHIESKVDSTDRPPHPVIQEVVDILQQQKLNNPRIPNMLTAYFVDMRKVICEWAKVLATGAKVAMVVDNVRFEGEMVPVDLVLSEMAEEFNFKVEEIIVARYKGNSSQQMGKYGRVPVRESIVIWEKQ